MLRGAGLLCLHQATRIESCEGSVSVSGVVAATEVPDEANMFQISAFAKLVSSITMVVFSIQTNSLLI